jgi:hypothetical protein
MNGENERGVVRRRREREEGKNKNRTMMFVANKEELMT